MCVCVFVCIYIYRTHIHACNYNYYNSACAYVCDDIQAPRCGMERHQWWTSSCSQSLLPAALTTTLGLSGLRSIASTTAMRRVRKRTARTPASSSSPQSGLSVCVCVCTYTYTYAPRIYIIYMDVDCLGMLPLLRACISYVLFGCRHWLSRRYAKDDICIVTYIYVCRDPRGNPEK